MNLQKTPIWSTPHPPSHLRRISCTCKYCKNYCFQLLHKLWPFSACLDLMVKVKGEVRPQSPDTEYMYISIMVRLSIKAWPLLAELSLADVESLVSMMLQKISTNRVLCCLYYTRERRLPLQLMVLQNKT